MAEGHSAHLAMLYEELESQRKLLASFMLTKGVTLSNVHICSVPSSKIPLDEGSVWWGLLQTFQ